MITDLFKIPVYAVDLEIDIETIKNFCYKNISESSGRKRSNSGGWQSNDLLFEKELGELKLLIDIHSKIFADQIGITLDRGVCSIWVNQNKFGDYNKTHVHPGSKLSGAFYVKVPDDGGKIFFFHPSYHYMQWCDVELNGSDTPYNWGASADCSDGGLILFPSWLEHNVEPNMNKNEDRISISFNIN